MFTTIMYGFINEVTRQPEIARLSLSASRGAGQERPAASKARRAFREGKCAGMAVTKENLF